MSSKKTAGDCCKNSPMTVVKLADDCQREGLVKGEGRRELYILDIRTPPWEAICFTQTGQRFGELTANYD